MHEGNFLFFTGAVQPGRWNADDLRLTVQNVEFLADIKEQKIEKISIELPLENLDASFCSDLCEIIEQNSGSTNLSIGIIDIESATTISLDAKGCKVNVNKDFMNFVTRKPGATIYINDKKVEESNVKKLTEEPEES